MNTATVTAKVVFDRYLTENAKTTKGHGDVPDHHTLVAKVIADFGVAESAAQVLCDGAEHMWCSKVDDLSPGYFAKRFALIEREEAAFKNEVGKAKTARAYTNWLKKRYSIA